MTKREYYDGYDANLKLNLEQRTMFENGVAMMVNALRSAGVTWSQVREKDITPMSDVMSIDLWFWAPGDFRLRDVTIGSWGGCGTSICLEPRPEEENDQYDPNEGLPE